MGGGLFLLVPYINECYVMVGGANIAWRVCEYVLLIKVLCSIARKVIEYLTHWGVYMDDRHGCSF